MVLWPLFSNTTYPTLAKLRWKPAAGLTDEKQPIGNHSLAGEGKGSNRDQADEPGNEKVEGLGKGRGHQGAKNTSFV